MEPVCPYCGSPSKLVKGSAIYPHRYDLRDLPFYRCAPCKAYVGCHKGTTKPLGRLANAELRAGKSEAHAAFDPIWKCGLMKRSDAYRWLAEKTGIPYEQCHIGMMDLDQCRMVVKVSTEYVSAHSVKIII